MKKVYRQLVFYKGDREAVKVADDFVIYWDKTLRRHEVMNTDVPHYFEMYYDDDLDIEMEAMSNYGFDPKCRSFTPDSKRIKVPKDYLISQNNYKRFKELLLLIYVLTDKYFFQYDHTQGWFAELYEGNKLPKKLKFRYGQLYYHSNKIIGKNIKRFQNENMILTLNPSVFTLRDENDVLKKFINLSDLIKGFYKLNSKIQNLFLSAFLSYYEAYSINSRTLSFISLINSIEVLVNHRFNQKIESCECCGQPVYAVSQKFHSFIKELWRDYNGTAMPKDRDKRITEIYNLRSNIVHTGLQIQRQQNFWKTEQETKSELVNQEIYNQSKLVAKSVIKEYLLRQIYLVMPEIAE